MPRTKAKTSSIDVKKDLKTKVNVKSTAGRAKIIITSTETNNIAEVTAEVEINKPEPKTRKLSEKSQSVKLDPPEPTKTKGKKVTKNAKDNGTILPALLEAPKEEIKKPIKRGRKKEVISSEVVNISKDTKNKTTTKKLKAGTSKPITDVSETLNVEKKKSTKGRNINISSNEDVPKTRTLRTRKRAVSEQEEKPEVAKAIKILKNSVESIYNQDDFKIREKDGEKKCNFKISSWNVAGLRSWLKKDGLKFLDFEKPDIFCLQEIKCSTEQIPDEAESLPGYHRYWLCMPGGYAGVAIYSKIMPINVEYGIGDDEFDKNGRIITAEYEKFFLINVYVPNSGRNLVNLEERMRWDKLFHNFIEEYNAKKPVVICGDMNVSHKEIDLANPKANIRRAGFTIEERDGLTELLKLGYIDTFRYLYPELTGAYTYWTYMSNARSRNVGWRLDYFIVAERFIKRILDNCIRSQCMGSDHCPITLLLNI